MMVKSGPSVAAFAAGCLAAFVGFASTFVVVVQGLGAMGATPEQATSGLTILAIAMGGGGLLLSLQRKIPVSLAWSTPGAALLANTGAVEGGFPAAVGAFLACGVAILVAGSWKPLARAVTAIPASLANAMLAGVLLGFCLAPVRAVAAMPILGLAIVIVWALVARFRRLWAVPAALLVTIGLISLTQPMPQVGWEVLLPRLEFVWPVFSPGALVGITLPLFIVTMASQNIPGIAVLNANGYQTDAGSLFRATGWFSLAAAPFGGHAVNLAAITAALCAGPEADPDPARRYWAAAVSGIVYILFGLMAGGAMALISAAPPVLIQAVAGLGLLGAFGGAIVQALAVPTEREAAVITFIVTASGLSFLGIGGAFWGLVAGWLILRLARWRA